MKTGLVLVVAVGLGVFVNSCGSADSGHGTRVIDSVSPYSTLSDRELNTRYLARLLELQALNEEMEEANDRRDYAAVNAKARTGLEMAYDARKLAGHLDDPKSREERLEGINKIIADLEHVAQITS